MMASFSPELLWVLGGFAGIGVMVVSTVVEKLGRLSERVTRLEAVIAMVGENAARILHSPHDPYGVDDLLDKYIDRDYELSFDEWNELKTRCDAITHDEAKPKAERILAAFLAAVATHKLTPKFYNPTKI